MISKLLAPVRWVIASAVLPTLSFGQAAPAPAPATPATPKGETIQLAEFTVTAEDEQGYYAPAALSGTRTKTELMNLPMNLNVLTEQFIKDINATDLVDIVTYTAGLTASTATSGDTFGGDTTGFSLRGFGTHVPYRNGFRRIRIVDPTNIARVEVIKGPSSVLYGTAFPGGSVNYVTKRPVQNRRITDVTLRAGSYDMYRAELDVNVPITLPARIPGKLAVRFVGAYEDSDSFVDRMHTDLTLVNPVVTYWFRPETYVTLEYERTKKDINGFRGALPFHPLLDMQTAGFPIDHGWNTHAAGDYMDHDMSVFTAEVVHRLSRNFTLRGNYTRSVWEELTRRNGDAAGLATENAYNASPWLQPVRMATRTRTAYAGRGSWDDYYQAELVNTFSIRGVDSQTLFGAQRSVETFRGLFSTLSPGTTPGGRPAVSWELANPATWVVTEDTEQAGSGFNPNGLGTMGRSRFDTLYITNQLSFFEGRVRTMAGYRIDKFKSDGHNSSRNIAGEPITPVWNQQTLPHYETPQYGILFKPLENVSVFAQYSESVINLFLTQQRREDGTRFMPTPGRGEGYDIGVKSEFMDRKLAITASVFRIDNANIIRILAQVPDPEAPGTTFSPADQGGVQRSEGFDIDVRWRPFKGNELTFGYANIDAFVLEASEFVTIDGERHLTRKGHQLGNSAKRTASMWMRQDLGQLGSINNVWVGAGFRFVGNRPTEDTYRVIDYTGFTPANIAGNGANVNFAGGRLVEPWRLQSYTIFDLGFGGTFQVGKVRYNASVSVKNLTDESYFVHRVHFGAPRTFEGRITMSF